MKDEQIKQEELKGFALEDEMLEDVSGGKKTRCKKIVHMPDGSKKVSITWR